MHSREKTDSGPSDPNRSRPRTRDAGRSARCRCSSGRTHCAPAPAWGHTRGGVNASQATCPSPWNKIRRSPGVVLATQSDFNSGPGFAFGSGQTARSEYWHGPGVPAHPGRGTGRTSRAGPGSEDPWPSPAATSATPTRTRRPARKSNASRRTRLRRRPRSTRSCGAWARRKWSARRCRSGGRASPAAFPSASRCWPRRSCGGTCPTRAGRDLIVAMGYPVGFLMVVLSRQQLFTETTITVMLPLMKEPTRRHFTCAATHVGGRAPREPRRHARRRAALQFRTRREPGDSRGDARYQSRRDGPFVDRDGLPRHHRRLPHGGDGVAHARRGPDTVPHRGARHLRDRRRRLLAHRRREHGGVPPHGEWRHVRGDALRRVPRARAGGQHRRRHRPLRDDLATRR